MIAWFLRSIWAYRFTKNIFKHIKNNIYKNGICSLNCLLNCLLNCPLNCLLYCLRPRPPQAQAKRAESKPGAAWPLAPRPTHHPRLHISPGETTGNRRIRHGPWPQPPRFAPQPGLGETGGNQAGSGLAPAPPHPQPQFPPSPGG